MILVFVWHIYLHVLTVLIILSVVALIANMFFSEISSVHMILILIITSNSRKTLER